MIRTTTGDIESPATGVILAHEHIHTDLLPLNQGGDRKSDASQLAAAVEGKLRRAAAAGTALLVECTPPYVGQHLTAVHAACQDAGIPLTAATGLYKEDFWPPWALSASPEELFQWMQRHISEGIDGTGMRAGFIKLAVTDSGPTAAEDRALAAAVRASLVTGAAIASHCPSGRNALHQLSLIERLGGDPGRYIQVHAHAELDFALHLEVFRRGGWIEYDGIGGSIPDARFVDLASKVFDAGFGHKLLLSQDVCGYLVDREPHSDEREYAYLPLHFVPKLREAGFGEHDVDQMVRVNPASAFSMRTIE